MQQAIFGFANGQRKLWGERSGRKTNVFGPPQWVGDLGMNQMFFLPLQNSGSCTSQDGYLKALTRKRMVSGRPRTNWEYSSLLKSIGHIEWVS